MLMTLPAASWAPAVLNDRQALALDETACTPPRLGWLPGNPLPLVTLAKAQFEPVPVKLVAVTPVISLPAWAFCATPSISPKVAVDNKSDLVVSFIMKSTQEGKVK
jgi:hypothetical protein